MRRSRSIVQTLLGPDDAVDPRVDAVELRLDLYDDFVPECEQPVIRTVRRVIDGGKFTGSEVERLALLRGAEHVDLEVDVETDRPRSIVSFHDTRGMPADLDAVFTRCMLTGADRIKISTTPQSAVDAFRLLDLPCAGIGMGVFGEFTRVLAPLTYCAREPVAPGMPTPDELFDVFRVRRLGQNPALVGVVGDPIGHSKSPHIFNAAFETDGIDAVYLRFLVSDLAPFWPVFLEHGGCGLSVTAPLKVQAAGLAKDPSEEVVRCGSANTLLKDGRAFNTDYTAFRELVPSGSGDALVLGAGGAARAAIVALKDLGYDVKVWARSTRGLDADFVPEPFAAPIVINTTPLDPPPAPLLLDLRYGPANDAGLEFLRVQAKFQYAHFVSVLPGRCRG